MPNNLLQFLQRYSFNFISVAHLKTCFSILSILGHSLWFRCSVCCPLCCVTSITKNQLTLEFTRALAVQPVVRYAVRFVGTINL
nr:MAG TPA: hypothetical protein [Caudoviricetes sp.]